MAALLRGAAHGPIVGVIGRASLIALALLLILVVLPAVLAAAGTAPPTVS